MKIKPKLHSLRSHAKRRAFERYGMSLNRKDIDEMVHQIQSGKAIFIEKQSIRVSKFAVVVRDTKMVAIYDKVRKTIVTVLPVAERGALTP